MACNSLVLASLLEGLCWAHVGPIGPSGPHLGPILAPFMPPLLALLALWGPCAPVGSYKFIGPHGTANGALRAPLDLFGPLGLWALLGACA
jgi:hypothetical protein